MLVYMNLSLKRCSLELYVKVIAPLISTLLFLVQYFFKQYAMYIFDQEHEYQGDSESTSGSMTMMKLGSVTGCRLQDAV